MNIERLQNLSFRAQLSMLLSEAGVSQYEAAKGSGVNESSISRYMTGRRSQPQSKTLEKIARYFSDQLGCNYEALLGVLSPVPKDIDPEELVTTSFYISAWEAELLRAFCSILRIPRGKFLRLLLEEFKRGCPQMYARAEMIAGEVCRGEEV